METTNTKRGIIGLASLVCVSLLGIILAAVGYTSCSSDHDHFMNDYVAGKYYYHDGYYYSDPNFHYRYDFDRNHYYYGRLEWKGDYLGWCIVLRENPYYGLICQVANPIRLNECLYNVHDQEVMVRISSWAAYIVYGNVNYYPIVVSDIHYR